MYCVVSISWLYFLLKHAVWYYFCQAVAQPCCEIFFIPGSKLFKFISVEVNLLKSFCNSWCARPGPSVSFSEKRERWCLGVTVCPLLACSPLLALWLTCSSYGVHCVWFFALTHSPFWRGTCVSVCVYIRTYYKVIFSLELSHSISLLFSLL